MAQDNTTDELNEFFNDLLESNVEGGDNPLLQQQEQEQQDDELLHPISCSYCRKNHRDIPIQQSDFENYYNMAQNGVLKDDVINAILFGCQALIDQRLGDKEASKLSFNKARKLIQPYFDNIDDINVGCVYFLFCSFEASNANYRKVALYYNILKTFVDEIVKMENSNIKLTTQMKRLKSRTRFIEMTMSTSQDIDCNNPLAIAKMFPRLVYVATGVDGFAELCAKLEHLDKDRIEEHLATVDSVCIFMNNHMRQMDESGDRKNVIDLMGNIVSNGMKLASYLTVDNDNWEKIMTYSTNITTATENPLFVFLPAAVVSHVAMAAKQHLRLWSLIRLGMVSDFFQGKNTLSQLIYQSYRALSILSTRFDRVQKFYSDLYQELEHFIKEYFTQQNQLDSTLLNNTTIVIDNNTATTTNEPLLPDLQPPPPESSFTSMLDDSFFFDPPQHFE
ncbi:predicted protein [Naegleria gruberi]|uniref:Predicted protein n=1 Tax=Naegleria gruberi TaxID=5762 RepID=D2W1A5_NAEGR|nr:uncharacterized protein NAEGRDRAFT_53921 [Naegleria gruberi]EFC37150.1 predicted protein [Naegleria gruberi]|eukprot:XP_002669894.1 predicted protein [Naegleria gruberi strain NEG-M]